MNEKNPQMEKVGGLTENQTQATKNNTQSLTNSTT